MKTFSVKFTNKHGGETLSIKVNANGVDKAKATATKSFKATNKSKNIADYDITVTQMQDFYYDDI